MLDQQRASNYTFKARLFIFAWLAITGVGWFLLESIIDNQKLEIFHVFLQAWVASFMPVRLLGNVPHIQVNGQSYVAEELVSTLLQAKTVQVLIDQFLIYLPMAALLLTSLTFYLVSKRKKEKIEFKNDISQWKGH